MASSTRIDSINAYLADLVIGFNALQTEKKTLLAAATRLPQINTAMQDLMADAQTALDRLNALQGTTLTLQDIRAKYTPPDAATPIPISVDPNQIAAALAEKGVL